MRRLIFLLVVLLLPTSEAFTAQCDVLPKSGAKPVLNGHVQDDAQGLGFLWWSKAYMQQNWGVENGVCNSGTKNLIVSWPKTLLFADAYNALPPGGNILNSFPVPGEPSPGLSEIRYGYSGAKTTAEHYEVKLAASLGGPLYSRIEAYFPKESTTEVARPPSVHKIIAYYFQAFNKGNAYEFTFYPKTDYARSLWVGISSSQNALFKQASDKLNRKVELATLNSFVKQVPQGWADGLDKVEFFLVPPSDKFEQVKLLIPISPKKIELARVILFDAEHHLVAAGRVALFGQ